MSIIVNKKTNISFLWHFCFYPKFFDIELTTDELQNLGSFWNIDERFVNDIVLKWTDWHTDYLFHGYRKENIRTVRVIVIKKLQSEKLI